MLTLIPPWQLKGRGMPPRLPPSFEHDDAISIVLNMSLLLLEKVRQFTCYWRTLVRFIT